MTWDDGATRSELEAVKADLDLLNLNQLIKVQHYIDHLIRDRTDHIDKNKYHASGGGITSGKE
jgi:hypothetical protein